MPNHDDFQRNLVAPPAWTGVCDEWCAGLHLIERELADHPDIDRYDAADFMVMGALRRTGHPLLYLYKHVETRAYLNIDAAGVAWRYVPPRRGDDGDGRYVRHRSLEDAFDALRLWELDDVDDVDEEDEAGDLADWGDGGQ